MSGKELEFRGSHRAKGRMADEESAAAEACPLTVLPPAPAFLGAISRFEWSRVGNLLVDQRKLAEGDLGAFTGYCVNVGRAADAEAVIRVKGMTLQAFGGEMLRPEIAVAKAAWAEVLKFSKEFGLTPAARAKVKTPPAPAAAAETNPFAATRRA